MELIKHECGVAMIRLRKPLDFYKQKYGTEFYGLNKLYLMMEKQHNRGQEGAGVGCVKLDVNPGNEYIFRERAEGSDAIKNLFSDIHSKIKKVSDSPESMEIPFLGEVYMGHLRYSTTGRSGISYVHPFLRRNNWRARNMLLCGNFNMTNVDDIFEKIRSTGQHPRIYSDAFILLEQLGHALDMENERWYREYSSRLKGQELAKVIEENIDPAQILRRCAPDWDGGFVICGIIGNGDMWVIRDPSGIRPAFYYIDDEVVVVASERPVIQTAFDLRIEDVKELQPGHAMILDITGTPRMEQILAPKEKKSCSFERIYFSRGSDQDIYRERKALGEKLVPSVFKAINGEIESTVFSFVPNTAEVAYMGLTEGFENLLVERKIEAASSLLNSNDRNPDRLRAILQTRVRKEKVAWKDIKLRTFIAQGDTRNDMASHVYDITYGSLRPGVDNLVIIDDSIVRGTTLRQSIIRILNRLGPKKIVIVSSSPQVRYPDCYGIDMSRLGEFIAFRAAMELLRERGMENIIKQTYNGCLEQVNKNAGDVINCVKNIYAPFSDDEISAQISKMLTPDNISAEVEIVYQSVDDMHEAIPDHRGDWYFTGDYPTNGGIRLVNKAYINYYEGNFDKRV